MHILLNGEPREVAEGATLAQLVGTLDLENRRYAVEINETLIPRSEHAAHALRVDDRIEIVQAIGGG
jgi:sulfur carrier protein